MTRFEDGLDLGRRVAPGVRRVRQPVALDDHAWLLLKMINSFYGNFESEGSGQIMEIRREFSAVRAASRLVQFPLRVALVALAMVPFLVNSIEAHVRPRQHNPPPSYTAVLPKPMSALPT